MTVTFDAFPGKSFSGKIISIDTIGSVSSGVTVYPAFIKLDTEVPEIFSNMTANADIITQIKDNVLLVPISSIQTRNGRATIRVLKNGRVQNIEVETGISSNSQTEIVSGLKEGDMIISGNTVLSTPLETSNQTRSPFSGFGGGGGAIFRR